jgi:hypothetical protein
VENIGELEIDLSKQNIFAQIVLSLKIADHWKRVNVFKSLQHDSRLKRFDFFPPFCRMVLVLFAGMILRAESILCALMTLCAVPLVCDVTNQVDDFITAPSEPTAAAAHVSEIEVNSGSEFFSASCRTTRAVLKNVRHAASISLS